MMMTKRTTWNELKQSQPLTAEGRAAYDDEARIAAFRDLVYRLRTDADLTQAELAQRMGTTQSAIARMEGGGTRPTLETLEKVASAVGADLVVGVGEHLSENRSIAKLVREGRAVVRKAS
jgi:transcriptional regulator with XRE-family HTH domain